MADGFAEGLKCAAVADAGLFAHYEENAAKLASADLGAVTEVIARALAVKRDLVEKDPRDWGVRRLLNYGHTIGHAVEAATGEYSHGEAVAIGMNAVARYAAGAGLLEDEDLPGRQADVLRRLDLPMTAAAAPGEIVPFLARDKKRAGGTLSIAVAVAVGKGRVVEVDDPAALAECVGE